MDGPPDPWAEGRNALERTLNGRDSINAQSGANGGVVYVFHMVKHWLFCAMLRGAREAGFESRPPPYAVNT